jgi:hypothetical protein
MGVHSNVPVFLHTSTDEIVRRIDIVLQIIGKASGGGCHHGRRRSLNTGSSLFAEGRELSRGENILDRRLKKAKNSVTRAVGRVVGS